MNLMTLDSIIQGVVKWNTEWLFKDTSAQKEYTLYNGMIYSESFYSRASKI